MGKALYRKYRPKKLSEIIGQDHITRTLSSSLKQRNFSHAYLFTGPRGSGKTSIARIMAHEVNGLVYDEEATHLDIIEIDAASNRRIDEIRSLREKVHNAPTSVDYKVYIIDEVHMLTKEAFNALLKTLEEPPAHAIFILATTESHKLPDTIISRCIRFTFRPVSQEKAVIHLRDLAERENISIDDSALELIAQHGSGSFRDSISLLDQLGGQGGGVNLEKAREALGLAPESAVANLIELISDNQVSGLVGLLQELYQSGYSAPQLSSQLSQKLRGSLIEGSDKIERRRATSLLKSLLEVPASHDPSLLLELALLDSISDEPSQSSERPIAKPKVEKSISSPVSTSQEKKPAITSPKKPPITKANSEQETSQPNNKTSKPPEPSGEFDTKQWADVLNELKKEHNTLYGIARMSEPRISGDKMVLVFRFPFHKRRFDDSRNKQILSDLVTQTTGHQIIISSVVEKDQTVPTPAQPKPKPKPAPKNDALKNVSDIFGDAEMLE